ncbi:hypothetical protein DYD21_10165 [Rhodohalobacter sp. SW132]|nr:hypothetical protein DYD21_10165 [Rhodohalobacter sp. SW132]
MKTNSFQDQFVLKVHSSLQVVSYLISRVNKCAGIHFQLSLIFLKNNALTQADPALELNKNTLDKLLIESIQGLKSLFMNI